MSLGQKNKDPRDRRIFSFDWTAELGTDTIVSSNWEFDPSGLTKHNEGIVAGNKKTTVELSGGSVGSSYTVRNIITRTTSGEMLARSGRIAVREL